MIKRMFEKRLLTLKIFLLAMALLSIPGISSGSELMTLSELEEMVTASPEVLQAAAVLAESTAFEERQRAVGGLRYFGEVAFSDANEPESHSDDSRVEGYSSGSARGGIQIPLFGTWRKERIMALESHIRTLEDERRLVVLKKLNLDALRKAYIQLWSSQSRRAVLSRFLDFEPMILPLLAGRTREGFLLERERLEMESWFSLARREFAAAALTAEESLAVIRKAVGREDLFSLSTEYPLFPPLSYSRSLLSRYVHEENAELALLEQSVEKKREIALHAPKSQYEATLRTGYYYSRDFPGGNTTEGFVSFGVDVPVRESKAAAAAKRAALADAEKAEYEGAARRLDLLAGILEGVSRYDFALSQREFSLFRLRSAVAGIRADRLRYALLPGDTLEQLFRSSFDYLSASLAFLESESAVLQTHAELLGMIPETLHSGEGERSISSFFHDEGERVRLLDPSWLVFSGGSAAFSAPERRSEKKRALYLWEGDNFLLSGQGEAVLRDVSEAGFSRVFLSFSSQGIIRLKEKENRRKLKAILAAASSLGVSVELLLGDPSWILPAHRKELTGLVSFLGDIPFSGLHLDLEPDQLPGSESRRKELLASLVETVREVSSVSPWPVGLSVHPRYLEGGLGPLAAKGFSSAGVKEVTVMIYSTNTAGVVKRMKALLSAWPGLALSLAVSVEKSLPKAESFFSLGRSNFRAVMEGLEKALVSPAFSGIVMQSWKEYKEMLR